MRVLVLAALLALAAAGLPAATQGAGAPGTPEDAAAVLEAVLDNLRGGPLRGTYTFVVERPGRATEYVMEIVTDGEERGLIRITAPPREAGQAFLMDGDDLWLYNARLGRSLRLPPSGRSSAFLGSDVSYNDIVGRDMEKDYTVAFAAAEAAAAAGAAEDTIVLELTPRQGAPTPYGRVIIAVEAANLTPQRLDYYDQRGQVVKRLVLSEYLESDGRRVPQLMVVEDRTREGYRTVVRLTDVEMGAAVPEGCFTLQALERGCL
ncbi:MAG TPA: outer membrane lipoprotein-sorting protein [Limnochordales bacterium]